MRLRRIALGLIAGLVVASLGSVAAAALKLPALIGDNMVLQQGQPVPIWGWADQGAEVTVSIAGQSASTKAGDHGRWKVALAKLKAGGPHELTIKAGDETRTIKNVLVGEVWVCSGQSNMEMGVGAAKDGKQEIAAANFPKSVFSRSRSTRSRRRWTIAKATADGRSAPRPRWDETAGVASQPQLITSAANCTSSSTCRSD